MNDKYDEAVDVSQSMDQGAKMEPEGKSPDRTPNMSSLPEEKSNSFMNKPFDEALEFSQSNSDESVDTRGSGGKSKAQARVEAKGGAPAADNHFQAKPQGNTVGYCG
jgi:hypothetical protein